MTDQQLPHQNTDKGLTPSTHYKLGLRSLSLHTGLAVAEGTLLLSLSPTEQMQSLIATRTVSTHFSLKLLLVLKSSVQSEPQATYPTLPSSSSLPKSRRTHSSFQILCDLVGAEVKQTHRSKESRK